MGGSSGCGRKVALVSQSCESGLRFWCLGSSCGRGGVLSGVARETSAVEARAAKATAPHTVECKSVQSDAMIQLLQIYKLNRLSCPESSLVAAESAPFPPRTKLPAARGGLLMEVLTTGCRQAAHGHHRFCCKHVSFRLPDIAQTGRPTSARISADAPAVTAVVSRVPRGRVIGPDIRQSARFQCPEHAPTGCRTFLLLEMWLSIARTSSTDRSQLTLPLTESRTNQNTRGHRSPHRIPIAMQDFSEWMTTLQSEQQVRGSPASSYAETDSDCDSDSSDDCQRRLDAKRRHVAKDKQRVWTRTAPISIPASSRQTHPHLCNSVEESLDLSYHADMRLLRTNRYLHDSDDDELDEDDPAFYGNLAFFRSQYGEKQSRLHKHSVNLSKVAMAPASPTVVDDSDEDIFAMELRNGRFVHQKCNVRWLLIFATMHLLHVIRHVVTVDASLGTTRRRPSSAFAGWIVLRLPSINVPTQPANTWTSVVGDGVLNRRCTLPYSYAATNCNWLHFQFHRVSMQFGLYPNAPTKHLRIRLTNAHEPRADSTINNQTSRNPTEVVVRPAVCKALLVVGLGSFLGTWTHRHHSRFRLPLPCMRSSPTSPASTIQSRADWWTYRPIPYPDSRFEPIRQTRPFSAGKPTKGQRRPEARAPKPQFAIVKAPLTPKHHERQASFCLTRSERAIMAPAQTQSLPTWTSNLSVALPITCKQTFEEDPAYLSGDDTDCESERGSDVLSREDQQLMANLMCLRRQRAMKHQQLQKPRPAGARTTPMMIPVQTRRYEETASKNWDWEEDDEDCEQCPCCQDRSETRSVTRPVEKVEPATVASVSDLMFDLEL